MVPCVGMTRRAPGRWPPWTARRVDRLSRRSARRADIIPLPEAIGTAAAMPTIFISHSCKDNEQVPPAGLSPQDATARAGPLAFSRKLRDALVTALENNQRYKVFLDVRGGLTAGDIWQDGLHHAL